MSVKVGDYVTANTKPKIKGTVRSIIKRENDTLAIILLKDQSCRDVSIELIEGYEEERRKCL